MWLKFCLLLAYICILFLLSRVMEAISWCDTGHSGVLSRQFLDPMLQSVVKLKSLLENRGVSYDSVVEKSELSSLVESSGPVTDAEMQGSCLEDGSEEETNFTSGAHFIEQVEDAKDSVWLVQVIMHSHHVKPIRDKNWNNVKRKASRFGVHTGILDCSLDVRYCQRRNWKMPVLILALPSHFNEKANVMMHNYSGSSRETAVLKWIRDKINDRIVRIADSQEFHSEWQNLSNHWLNPEIRAVLFTQSTSAPLFFSSLSVKFPGRVKFGLVHMNSNKNVNTTQWQKLLGTSRSSHLPAYKFYSAEGQYTYGLKPGEDYSFANMELFLKFLYPCLNDIFIISFCAANVMSWLEFFITNCSISRRFQKLIWCIFKYNVMVILLWLPIIGLFQMPFIDQVPLILLKLQRIFTTSDFGSVLRGDFVFYINNPIYVYVSFILYLIVVTFICKKYRDVEEMDENWLNFTQMPSLRHLRPNNLFEPVRISNGFSIFGSTFGQTSLWLQPSIPSGYIQNLPTWRFVPIPLSTKVTENSQRVKAVMAAAAGGSENDFVEIFREDVQNATSTSTPSLNLTDHASSDLSLPDSVPRKCQCDCEKKQTSGTSSGCFGGDGNVHLTESLPLSSASDPANHDCCCREKSGSNGQSMNYDRETLEVKGDRSDVDLPPSVQSPSHRFPKGYLESHQCVICLDEYVQHVMLCGLPCGHVFHESCILAWLNRDKHFCPMCRWPSFTRPSHNSA